MGPLMLAWGVLPQVSAANTSFMSMASALLNLIHYLLSDMLDAHWFVYMFCIGIFGGVVGRRVSVYINAKYGRPSLTVFLLSSVLFFSICLMVYRLAGTSRSDFTDWTPLC
jgi:uncharacterized membrane protein YfcA